MSRSVKIREYPRIDIFSTLYLLTHQPPRSLCPLNGRKLGGHLVKEADEPEYLPREEALRRSFYKDDEAGLEEEDPSLAQRITLLSGRLSLEERDIVDEAADREVMDQAAVDSVAEGTVAAEAVAEAEEVVDQEQATVVMDRQDRLDLQVPLETQAPPALRDLQEEGEEGILIQIDLRPLTEHLSRPLTSSSSRQICRVGTGIMTLQLNIFGTSLKKRRCKETCLKPWGTGWAADS
ncbi:hypothetical protein C8R47DRAFT_1205593 [Mycena vitilis]|nr:hypothetical protein C8R47DRAFT_1205593 [Mycena vitilis]